MNKLIIIFILGIFGLCSLVSALPFQNETANFTWAETATYINKNYSEGMIINVSYLNDSDNVYIYRVISKPYFNSTTVCIYQDIARLNLQGCLNYVSSTIYQSLTLPVRLNLTQNRTYYITPPPGKYNQSGAGGKTYPQPASTTYIKFVGSINDGSFDTSNVVNFENVSIFINFNATPLANISVNLSTPPNYGYSTDSFINFGANLYSNGYYNFTNYTTYIWYNNNSFFDKSNASITGQTNFTYMTMNMNTSGIYQWNVLACYGNTTYRNCTFAPQNFTFTYGYAINNNNFVNSTYETKNETFLLNISIDSTRFSGATANLIYNGTSYSTIRSIDSNLYFTKVLDIPSVTQLINKSFYWQIYLTDYSGNRIIFNSTINNQSISPLLFNNCNATTPAKLVNYSLYNETSLSGIVGAFKTTFVYFLGSGSVTKNYSVDLSGSNNYTFCGNTNYTYNVDAAIKVSSTGYNDRSYYLNDEKYNNATTNEPLYLIDGTARTVILEFKDTALSSLPGYYIQTSRYYESNNQEIQVHIDRTDNFGQVINNLVENTIKYRFKFYDPLNNLIKTSNQVVISCRYSVCVLTFLDERSNSVLDYNNITNYDYSFTFSNNTDTFVYTWNDNTGNSPFHHLLVEKLSAKGNEIVCNSSSTELSGSLSCTVGSDYMNYRAQAFRSASPEHRIGLLNIQVGDISAKFGIEGLFWSFILLVVLICVGAWYPPVGIALYLVGFIVLRLIGIVYAPPEVMIAELVLGVAFIWAFKG